MLAVPTTVLALLSGGCGGAWSAEVDGVAGGTVRNDGLSVTVPPGAFTSPVDLVVDEDDGDGFTGAALARTPRYEVSAGGDQQPRRSLVLRFDLDRKASPRSGRHLFVASQEGGSDRWRIERGRVVAGGRAYEVRASHLSSFQVFEWNASAARTAAARSLEIRTEDPGCDEELPDTVQVDVKSGRVGPGGDPPAWVCPRVEDGRLKIRVTSNRALSLQLSLPAGFAVTKTIGPSIPERVLDALNAAGRRSGFVAEGPLLPAGGEIELQATLPASGTVDFVANNTAVTIDAILTVVSAAVGGHKTPESVVSGLVSVADCLNEGVNRGHSWDFAQHASQLKALRGLIAKCAGPIVKTTSLRVLTGILTSVSSIAAGLVDTGDAVLRRADRFSIEVSARAVAAPEPEEPEEPEQAEQPEAAPEPEPEAPPPASEPSSYPTCQEWASLPPEEADQILREMNERHGWDPLSVLRLSVRGFCALYPGRRIDGIYGSKPAGSDVAVSGPAPRCSDWAGFDDAVADAWLREIMRRRGDSGALSTARLSVGLFCRLNPDRPIDGAYGG